MTLDRLLPALAQIAVAGTIGWAAASLLRSWMTRRREDPQERWGAPENILLAVVAFVMFCTICMLLHVMTGGAFFGTPGLALVPGVLVLWLGRRGFSLPRAVSWPAVALAVLIGTLYLAPVVLGGSGVRTGDAAWHMGWTQQLLAGEPVPTGPAPEFARNGYPWGFHAVSAALVRLVPGSDPLIAHEALHVIVIAGITSAAAALARRVRSDAGWWAAAAIALIGGFGWVSARGADFVASPARARYGADMVVASPNSVYELLPPAFPRELGLVLVAGAALLTAGAIGAVNLRRQALAGVAVGLAGLVSVPMFLTGLVWIAAACVLAPQGRRVRVLAAGWLPALAVFALWLGPLVSDYLRFGGFVDITPALGVEWPLPTALSAWGLLLPLAAVGVVLVVRGEGGAGGRMLGAYAAATIVMLALAVARGSFGWSLGGNETLLHQGRMWPPAHLVGATFAGIALAWLFSWLARRGVVTTFVGATALLALAIPSLVLSSIGLARIVRDARDGFVYAAPDHGRDSFVRRGAAHLGPDDVVLVDSGDHHRSDTLAFHLFEWSGARLARYDNPRLDGNELRIRFRDLADAWDARMAADGFDADYLVVPADDERAVDALEQGMWDDRRWVLVAL